MVKKSKFQISKKTMPKQAIIITGAAGGLGQAIVKAGMSAFPDKKIIATDISSEVLELFRAYDGVIPMELDVTSEKSIREVRNELEKHDIRIWGIVNNAGVSDFFPISEKEKKELERIFAINTFGPVNMVRAFLPHLMETKGRVVQISSESVRLPAAFHPYAASKIALEALSVSMRNELSLHGIRLSIIRPGAINTHFLDDLHNMKDRIGESIYKKPLLAFATQAPKEIHNICEPEDVAAVVVRALTKTRPKRYYRVNSNPKLRIAQLLPHKVRDYFMQRMLK
jgi:NAD(P)-dependent dehydrogenase (short-subunit alcohol dehydrogenase family)